MLPREATEDTEACLVVRGGGAAGGPIEVRWGGAEGRVRVPADATLAFEGVPVREAVALDAALKVFVGDLLGEAEPGSLPILAGRVLETGLGLGALRLFRLFRVASLPIETRAAAGLMKLLGRATFLTPGFTAAGG